MGLHDTPRSERLHIGIFGKVNSGKSTFLNMMTDQQSSLVSKEAGTTTDPVYKAMELINIGPVVFIDTAGFEDNTTLGEQRLEKTKESAVKSDIAIILFDGKEETSSFSWLTYFKERKTPVLLIINTYTQKEQQDLQTKISSEDVLSLCIDVKDAMYRNEVIEALLRLLPEQNRQESLTGNLVKTEDVVLLVMPQDLQAPKGRLILPQVQTIRELLDKQCIVMSCTTQNLSTSLASLKQSPNLIICDSQVFEEVYRLKPKESKLTSFSILLAGYKGDIQTFIEGAKAIETLNKHSHVLIAEACTHAPVSEDIGRVKIPMMLKKKYGQELKVSIVSGVDFPKDLTPYDLIIHCGGCMFNRKYVLARIEMAKQAKVPITNYGICIAYIKGILDKIDVFAH